MSLTVTFITVHCRNTHEEHMDQTYIHTKQTVCPQLSPVYKKKAENIITVSLIGSCTLYLPC
jgi:hypothetical protein